MTEETADQTRLPLAPRWEWVTDSVMGGMSGGTMRQAPHHGRPAVRMTGQISLENNGGFLQMAFDVDADTAPWTGLAFDAYGNGETYDIRLKTTDLERPWQSFRTAFVAPDRWTTVSFPFQAFEPYRTTVEFRPSRLRRIGVLAVGRAFEADIAISDVWFLR